MKSGDSFGFKAERPRDPRLGPYPIRAEFGGSLVNSLDTTNTNSAWNRWRRGFELATADLATVPFEYPFLYNIPLPPGVPINPGGQQPFLAGVLKGYPTENKELGMHWAGSTLAGSLRFDNLKDKDGVPLSIESAIQTDDFVTVKLAGTFSAANPIPPPLFVPGFFPGQPGIYPFNGNILEDRLVEAGGVPITRNTINPATQTRFGYTTYVLQEVRETTGELVLRKQGSVESTIDAVFITPARTLPRPGRFFINGARYCCSCQDFNRRQYYYVSTVLGKRKSPTFPRTNPATLKTGRYEFMTVAGQISSDVQTSIFTDRKMAIVAPSGYETSGIESIPAPHPPNDPFNTNRDLPGVFSDFGGIYLRGNFEREVLGTAAEPIGGLSEGIPNFRDYKSAASPIRGNPRVITQLNDRWSPVLDEFRYCKHIYAMRFNDEILPPEPSDVPSFGMDLVEYEEKLVADTEKKQFKAIENLQVYGLSHMDVPPFNCQAPMMMPMMQKLFNIPSNFIRLDQFTMFDKNGQAYTPALGEKPAK